MLLTIDIAIPFLGKNISDFESRQNKTLFILLSGTIQKLHYTEMYVPLNQNVNVFLKTLFTKKFKFESKCII